MLSTDWDIMRVLRLVIGIWLAVQAIIMMELFTGLIGLFFLYQAITGTGCGADGCYTAPRRNVRQVKTEDIDYEEVV
jgi:hypothetical protein